MCPALVEPDGYQQTDQTACRKKSKCAFNLFGMRDTPRVPVSNFYTETGSRSAALPDHLIGMKRHTPREGPDFVSVQPSCRNRMRLYTADLNGFYCPNLTAIFNEAVRGKS